MTPIIPIDLTPDPYVKVPAAQDEKELPFTMAEAWAALAPMYEDEAAKTIEEALLYGSSHRQIPMYPVSIPKCECGAEAIGATSHSSWCPKA